LIIIVTDVVLAVVLHRHPGPSLSDPTILAQQQLTMAQLINGGLGLVVAMILPSMPIISTVIGIYRIAVRFVPVLATDPSSTPSFAPGFTLIELVRDVYVTHARVFMISFVGATVGIGLPALVISGIITLAKRRLTQSPKAA
jgi:hypothetical protein